MFQKLTWFKIVRSHNCEINAEIQENRRKANQGPWVCDAFSSLPTVLNSAVPSSELLSYKAKFYLNSLFPELCKINTGQTLLDRQFSSPSEILLKFLFGANNTGELSSHWIHIVRFRDMQYDTKMSAILTHKVLTNLGCYYFHSFLSN